jgi:transketolase
MNGKLCVLERSREARRLLIQMHFNSGVGHIGCNLSCIDILLALHHDVMEEHDSFLLSKGHSAGALYVTLESIGRLHSSELASFHKDNTHLAGHTSCDLSKKILFATGSLGHGFSLACGMCLGDRLRGVQRKTFCLTSDGEWNEGSTWEALIFAAHHRLNNLTVIIDANGLQGFGTTTEVANLDPLADRIRAFGCVVSEIDGHDNEAIKTASKKDVSNVHVIVARTVKGKGVSFMENQLEWHYRPLTNELHQRAMSELNSI